MFAQKSVPSDKAVVLFLDGHSSWRGIEWLEKAKARNIEIIILPSNATHFLQPCDTFFNKRFQQTARKTRDGILRMGLTNVHAMGFKFKLALAAHISITPEIVRHEFVNIGLWPMDFCF